MNKQTKKIMILNGLIWIIANLHHPVTPTYFTEIGMPSHIFGTSYGAMVFAIFIVAPIWGSIGDQGYRKEVLVLAPILYGIVECFFARTRSLPGIILLRSLGGAAASGFNVGMMSALVDLNSGDNLKRTMTSYSAIMSLASAMGFLLGGLLGFLSPKYVFLIQGLSSILVGIWAYFAFDGINEEKRGRAFVRPRFIWNIIYDSKKNSQVEGQLFTAWIKIFLLITFFVGLAYSGYNNAFNYYLKAELEMKPIVNGIWKALIGLVGLVANLTINRWLIKNTDIRRSLVVLLGLSMLAAFLVFFKTSIVPFFIFSFIYFTIYTIKVPILQGFAVEDSIKDPGVMSGIFNAIKSLGEMIGATSAGFSYEISSKAPFLLGAVSLLLAFLLGLIYEVKDPAK